MARTKNIYFGLLGGILTSCFVLADVLGKEVLMAADAQLSCLNFMPVPVATGASGEVVANPLVANTARDGNIAIREEYDAAIENNTEAALRLFVARHPSHPLRELAQQRLDVCFGGKPLDTIPNPYPCPTPEF